MVSNNFSCEDLTGGLEGGGGGISLGLKRFGGGVNICEATGGGFYIPEENDCIQCEGPKDSSLFIPDSPLKSSSVSEEPLEEEDKDDFSVFFISSRNTSLLIL
ncbi:unnamed protein product [Rodentolepis nana]|uniref:Uncharacterized protein n=1 Tax=Rodentolepis nana TaxID=102285 RepID=A0A0R3TIU7_RODNA|nr:unnamed protein product [Rodentolepis nana]